MKKKISVLAAVLLAIGLTACGNNESQVSADTTQNIQAEPRIMDTFVESHSFDGITMIPFCTSSSSGIGRSGQNLADNAGTGTWLDGTRFGAGASEDEIRSWIEGLQ